MHQAGLRTSSLVRAELCPAYADITRVFGKLQIDPADPDVAWLEANDGRHMSVLWPSGFSIQPGVPPKLLNDQGEPVAMQGQTVNLEQTNLNEADGTYEHPYVAHGLVFGICYA